jgi:hypothetical protein
MKLVESQETIVRTNRSYDSSYKTIVDVSADWNATPVVITRQTYDLFLARVFEAFLRLHAPKKVYIETPLGLRRTTWVSFVAQQRQVYKSMCADYKSAGRDDDWIREYMEDSETTCMREFYSHCASIVVAGTMLSD